jgi:hypothetical protein
MVSVSLQRRSKILLTVRCEPGRATTFPSTKTIDSTGTSSNLRTASVESDLGERTRSCVWPSPSLRVKKDKCLDTALQTSSVLNGDMKNITYRAG